MILLMRTIMEIIAPFSLGMILLLLGAFLFVMRRYRASGIFNLCGTAVLFLFGSGFFSVSWLAQQENVYQPLDVNLLEESVRKEVRYVVVLGSGHTSDRRLPPTAEIGSASLYRLVEGIRILRTLPQGSLLVSGGKGFDSVANGALVAEVALSLGVDKDKLVIEERPEDTIEEAELLGPVLGEKPFILVTSAVHMARAAAIFANLGMRPIPAPTDFILKGDFASQKSLLPTCINLELSKRVMYEKLALLRSWL